MFTDTAYLKYICILRKKQKPGTLLSHSGPEKVPGFVQDRFRELFYGNSLFSYSLIFTLTRMVLLVITK